jgi:uncharacterized protein with FMN-binding domain
MVKTFDMPANVKKGLKVFHLMCVALIGGASFLMLVFFYLKNLQPSRIAAYDMTAMVLLNTIMPYPFYGVFLSSMTYSLFTNWGFSRHPWIVIKWGALVVLFLLVWFWGGPSIGAMASLSDIGLDDPARLSLYGEHAFSAGLFLWTLAASVILIMILSVVKPFKKREPRFLFPRTPLAVLLSLATIGGLVYQVTSEMEYQRARTLPVKNIDLAKIGDGAYGGHYQYGYFDYGVQVTVSGARIAEIKALTDRNVSYMTFAKAVFDRMIRQQKVDVDAVAGATTTSKALIKAVENALEGR